MIKSDTNNIIGSRYPKAKDNLKNMELIKLNIGCFFFSSVDRLNDLNKNLFLFIKEISANLSSYGFLIIILALVIKP